MQETHFKKSGLNKLLGYSGTDDTTKRHVLCCWFL